MNRENWCKFLKLSTIRSDLGLRKVAIGGGNGTTLHDKYNTSLVYYKYLHHLCFSDIGTILNHSRCTNEKLLLNEYDESKVC